MDSSFQTYMKTYKREANKFASRAKKLALQAYVPQGLDILADLCVRVSQPLKRKRPSKIAGNTTSQQLNESHKSGEARKHGRQGARQDEDYRSQYEWGYVPSKRRRAATSPFSQATSDPSAGFHTSQPHQPNPHPADGPSAGLPWPLHPFPHPSQPQSDHQNQPKGSGSTQSGKPASSESDLTTLFCDEQLPDAMADATEAVGPFSPPVRPPMAQPGAGADPFTAPALPDMPRNAAAPDGSARAPARSDEESPGPTPGAQARSSLPAGFQQPPRQGASPRQSSTEAALACAEVLTDVAKLGTSHAPAGLGDAEVPCGHAEGELERPDMPEKGPGAGPQCVFCLTHDTPQWRDGPDGPRTACNACSTAWQRARRPARPWLPGRVARLLAAQVAAAPSV